jgi:hypothetical protein
VLKLAQVQKRRKPHRILPILDLFVILALEETLGLIGHGQSRRRLYQVSAISSIQLRKVGLQ